MEEIHLHFLWKITPETECPLTDSTWLPSGTLRRDASHAFIILDLMRHLRNGEALHASLAFAGTQLLRSRLQAFVVQLSP